jgi:mono/diheme cytochrome c family protein
VKPIALAAALLLAGCQLVPPGATETPAWRGRDLAARNCAGCHNVNRRGGSMLAGAPPFRELALRDPASLRDFAADLRQRHAEAMPQILLDPRDAEDLYAYIRSLGSPDPSQRLPDVPPCFMRVC